MPMHNVSCIVRLSLYPLHHGGLCKNYMYAYSPEIISCSMQTANNECIRVYNGRLFCIVTHFWDSNEIGDLLTRQARNFIYRFQTVNIILYFVIHVLADCVLNH